MGVHPRRRLGVALPLLAVVPLLGRPHWAVGALTGMAVCCGFLFVFGGWRMPPEIQGGVRAFLLPAAMGAASGVVYAVAARRS